MGNSSSDIDTTKYSLVDINKMCKTIFDSYNNCFKSNPCKLSIETRTAIETFRCNNYKQYKKTYKLFRIKVRYREYKLKLFGRFPKKDVITNIVECYNMVIEFSKIDKKIGKIDFPSLSCDAPPPQYEKDVKPSAPPQYEKDVKPSAPPQCEKDVDFKKFIGTGMTAKDWTDLFNKNRKGK